MLLVELDRESYLFARHWLDLPELLKIDTNAVLSGAIVLEELEHIARDERKVAKPGLRDQGSIFAAVLLTSSLYMLRGMVFGGLNCAWNKTVVAALRGGGWNVQTFVDQPAKAQSRILG